MTHKLNRVPWYMVSELNEYEDKDKDEPNTYNLKNGGCDRQKTPPKKLNTNECLKILVKYNNILNIKWTQQ